MDFYPRGASSQVAPKSCHITLILRSLHWHRITERIEYKLLSITYKVVTTTQPPYLHNPISTQRPRSTRSLSVITLARPPSSSSLKITDRSFRYASPFLWNQLPLSLRKPHSGTSSSISCSPIHSPSLLPLLIHHFVYVTGNTVCSLVYFWSACQSASMNQCVHIYFSVPC